MPNVDSYPLLLATGIEGRRQPAATNICFRHRELTLLTFVRFVPDWPFRQWRLTRRRGSPVTVHPLGLLNGRGLHNGLLLSSPKSKGGGETPKLAKKCALGSCAHVLRDPITCDDVHSSHFRAERCGWIPAY